MTDLCFNWYNLMMKTNKIMKTEAKGIKHKEESRRTWSTGDVLTVNPCVMFSHSWVWKLNQQEETWPRLLIYDGQTLTHQSTKPEPSFTGFLFTGKQSSVLFFLLNPCGRDWTQLICLVYNDRKQLNHRDKSTNRGLILLIYHLSWSKTSERQLICFVNE